MAYKRVLGGEKNLKSGVRWDKNEIIEVYHLYKRINGVGLHEHNPEIQKTALLLGRTVRSVEAQTLMFRNLERSGVYSHGNMNKLTREVWSEFERSESDESNEIESLEDETEEIKETLKYSEWNKILVSFFFNEELKGVEIGCFPVSEELFQEVTEFEFSFEDFIHSVKMEIAGGDFFSKLKDLFENSQPKDHNGRKLRKPIPDYFGFMLFLIHALSQDEGKNMTVANVYDRINNFGQEYLQNSWGNINSSIARDLLEDVWQSLEDWSCNYLSGKKGLFIRHNPNNSQRKYVSRIERHSLFNSRQFSQIIDVLIEYGYGPDSQIDKEDWITFFSANQEKLPRAGIILDYISNESPFQNTVIAFLNSYLSQHFTEGVIASEKGEFRTPPIPLKICIESLPAWQGDSVEQLSFRARSEDLAEDVLINEDEEVVLTIYDKFYSERLALKVDLQKGAMISGKKNRYMTNKKVFWLTKNHSINEWVESEYPSNEISFLIIISKDHINESKISETIDFDTYPIQDSDHIVAKFTSLSGPEFDLVYNLYNPYKKIDGKIELIGNFTSNRRRCIYKEFMPCFRYIGPSAEPEIVAVNLIDGSEISQLIKVQTDTETLYKLPEEFDYSSQFQIKEPSSGIKARYNLIVGDLNADAINIRPPFLKDHEGVNNPNLESGEKDILDIPTHFNRDFEVTKFNGWHLKLFPLFKPGKSITSDFTNTVALGSKSDALLQFLALNSNITTYDFPKLIREIDSELSVRYSKIIMNHWRTLGYINFQDYGEQVKVTPSSILFLQSKKGLNGFLCGYRNHHILNQLIEDCNKLKIQVQYESHSNHKPDLFPSKIVLFDPDSDLSKFKQLQKNHNLHFVNDIQNPLNDRYVVYQLACLYTQRSVQEFASNLANRISYDQDHHRKRIYNQDDLNWTDSTKDISLINEGGVVRYEGFRDKSMTHIIKHKEESKVINDLGLAIFYSLKSNVLLKRKCPGELSQFDFKVPFFLGLPFWIERGLVLLNAKVPEVQRVVGVSYRVYKNIDEKILDVIEDKLSQKIIEEYD